MRRRERGDLARTLTNASVWILSGGMILAGCVLLLMSGWDWIRVQSQLSAFVSQLGGLLVATALVTFAWELLGRRQFSTELFGMANLSTDLRDAGMKRVGNWMVLDEPALWNDLYRDAKNIDILMVYSAQVIGTHRHRLVEAQKRGATVRVFLPDPDDDVTIDALSYRFNTDADSLRLKVRQAVQEIQDIQGRSGSGRPLSICLRKGPLTYACYRFDSRVVFTLYSQSRDRQPYVPTFMVEGGTLFDFFSGDLEALARADETTGEAEATHAGAED